MYFRVVQQPRDALAFQVVLDGERVGLTSVEFRDQAAVQRAIEAVIASLREGVDAALQVDGHTYCFTLRGEDGALLARGVPCSTPADADANLAELQRGAAALERFRIVNLARPVRTDETIQVAVRYDLAPCARAGKPGLELLNRPGDGLFTAHIHGERGDVLLYLRGFPTRFARDEHVETVLHAAADPRRYDRREADGRRYFVLTARNGREIARSPWFGSDAERDHAIAELVRLAPLEARADPRAQPRRKVADSGHGFAHRSTSGLPGFEAFRGDDGHHYFHLNDEHGDALLYSHGYSTAKARDHGVRSLLKGATDPTCYRIASDGLRFTICAVNGRELARSRSFRERAAMERAIAWIRREIVQFGRACGIRLWESMIIEVPHDPEELARQALGGNDDSLTRLAPPTRNTPDRLASADRLTPASRTALDQLPADATRTASDQLPSPDRLAPASRTAPDQLPADAALRAHGSASARSVTPAEPPASTSPHSLTLESPPAERREPAPSPDPELTDNFDFDGESSSTIVFYSDPDEASTFDPVSPWYPPPAQPSASGSAQSSPEPQQAAPAPGTGATSEPHPSASDPLADLIEALRSEQDDASLAASDSHDLSSSEPPAHASHESPAPPTTLLAAREPAPTRPAEVSTQLAASPEPALAPSTPQDSAHGSPSAPAASAPLADLHEQAEQATAQAPTDFAPLAGTNQQAAQATAPALTDSAPLADAINLHEQAAQTPASTPLAGAPELREQAAPATAPADSAPLADAINLHEQAPQTTASTPLAGAPELQEQAAPTTASADSASLADAINLHEQAPQTTASALLAGAPELQEQAALTTTSAPADSAPLADAPAPAPAPAPTASASLADAPILQEQAAPAPAPAPTASAPLADAHAPAPAPAPTASAPLADAPILQEQAARATAPAPTASASLADAPAPAPAPAPTAPASLADAYERREHAAPAAASAPLAAPNAPAPASSESQQPAHAVAARDAAGGALSIHQSQESSSALPNSYQSPGLKAPSPHSSDIAPDAALAPPPGAAPASAASPSLFTAADVPAPLGDDTHEPTPPAHSSAPRPLDSQPAPSALEPAPSLQSGAAPIAAHEPRADAGHSDGTILASGSTLAEPPIEQATASDSSHSPTDPPPVRTGAPLLPGLEDAAPLYRLQAPPVEPADTSQVPSVLAAGESTDTATTPHGDESEADAPASRSAPATGPSVHRAPARVTSPERVAARATPPPLVRAGSGEPPSVPNVSASAPPSSAPLASSPAPASSPAAPTPPAASQHSPGPVTAPYPLVSQHSPGPVTAPYPLVSQHSPGPVTTLAPPSSPAPREVPPGPVTAPYPLVSQQSPGPLTAPSSRSTAAHPSPAPVPPEVPPGPLSSVDPQLAASPIPAPPPVPTLIPPSVSVTVPVPPIVVPADRGARPAPSFLPPITNPYPRPFIPPGTLAVPAGPHRPSSASTASGSLSDAITIPELRVDASSLIPADGSVDHGDALSSSGALPSFAHESLDNPVLSSSYESLDLSASSSLEAPIEHHSPPAPADPSPPPPSYNAFLDLPPLTSQQATTDAPALVPELDVLLRDPPIPSPRRREGSAPAFLALREPSSTHAVPVVQARREPSSAQSSPALVPALDALEFDAPGAKPRRSLPNLIPDANGRGASPRPAAPERPRRDLFPAPAPKDSAPAAPPTPLVASHDTLLPIGLANTQPAALNVPPTTAPPAPPSVAVPMPTFAPRLSPVQQRWLGIGVAVALLLFIVARLAWYANRNTGDVAELSERASADVSTLEPPAPPEPPPATSVPPAPTAPIITCPEGQDDDPAIGLLVVPAVPVAGEPVRLLAAALADDLDLSLHLLEVPGPLEIQARAGLPAAALTTWTPRVAGEYTVAVLDRGLARACRTVRVESAAPELSGIAPAGQIWPVEREWTGAEEALYSAWVRELFRPPAGADPSAARFDQLTTDPARNLLHGALGLGEDDPDSPDALRLKPDGGDLPYFLRAYWSWKRRLPFAYRKCSDTGPAQPARCSDPRHNFAPGSGYSGPEDELARVRRFFQRNIAWGVHPGNVRTAIGDSESDLYPVRLERRALRPGAVYADPHGQVSLVVDLTLARDGEPGVLRMIDGRPDGLLARRRFWEGEFLWTPDLARGGAGFKQFRPIVQNPGGDLVSLDDPALAESPVFGDIWTTDLEMSSRQFYDAVAALIEPPPWDPSRVSRDAALATAELARVRVDAVARAVEYVRGHKRVIAMPRGAQIFAGAGAWGSHSTPGRDLRLLLALDVVRQLPDRVRERPDLFTGGHDPEGLVRAVELELDALLRDPAVAITYTRSDGSPWTLTLRDLLDRGDALERAYNPNDCPELRWGAPQGSDELATCSARAPADQRARMEAYRPWFRQRRLPAPGDKAP